MNFKSNVAKLLLSIVFLDKPFSEHRLKKIDKSHLTKEYSLETLKCYQETTETNSCSKSHSLNEVNQDASMEHCLSNVVTVISTVKSVAENKENKELQCTYAEGLISFLI